MSIKELKINLAHHSYPIFIGNGLTDVIFEKVKAISSSKFAIIITDNNLYNLYRSNLESVAKSNEMELHFIVVDPGENSKSLTSAESIYNQLYDLKIERKTPIIAFGGGVIGDLAGFVASTYLRGLPFIQVPTSLLAMVDSSVGGKVGINLPKGKNLIGSFYHPHAVIIDSGFLKTLPKNQFAAGMAECIKHGILGDSSIFEDIEKNYSNISSLNSEHINNFIYKNVSLKASIVEKDEKEQNIRAYLNLGHTFGHAIESATNYSSFLHGEAVALGIVSASKVSLDRSLITNEDFSRIKELLKLSNLPVTAKLPDAPTLYSLMFNDKKVQDGAIRFILPTKIGECKIEKNLSKEEIIKAIEITRDNG